MLSLLRTTYQLQNGLGVGPDGSWACLEQHVAPVPVGIADVDTLAAYPPAETGALLDEGDLHVGLLARKVESS